MESILPGVSFRRWISYKDTLESRNLGTVDVLCGAISFFFFCSNNRDVN